jgi:CRISPR-associated protein Csd1
MILQALTAYYQRMSSDLAPEGFQRKDIPFIIILDREGRFKGLQDTREGEGKKARTRSFVVPREVNRSGSKAWEKANLLWDNEGYVLGYSKKNPEWAKRQHETFLARIKEIYPDPTVDEGINAVVQFLKSKAFKPVYEHPLWTDIEKRGANISFQLEGDDRLIVQREAVANTIMQKNEIGDTPLQPCLVTGDFDVPTRSHTRIQGVWGAQPSGARIVSFNLDAFNSYKKTQGFNAPVGMQAEFAYTTALNTLLAKGSRQRIQVGDASTVFWAEKAHELENLFADFFGEPPKEQSDQDNVAIKAVFKAPMAGTMPFLDDKTRFYVLGLSPNASRIAIRFWYAGTVGEVVQHVRQHFEDCAIDRGPNQPEYLSLFRLLASTALQGKSNNIQPNLGGEFMKSIMAGTPYPQILLSAAVRRIRAEHEITYPRASLIKAVLARANRFYNKNEKEVGMSLDSNNVNPGYLLGRLFAVLERAQELASPGINATIRDRFYGAASSTPVAVFPHLLKLKNHHISKLESRGAAVNLEKQIGEIMSGMSDFPTHLSLPDQGRFAIGYYHQRQDFYRKKDVDVND